MSAKLILIPTPINDELPLEPIALKELEDNWSHSIIAVEEAKIGRRRWLSWGLPREAIEEFILYNEHTRQELALKLLSELQSGKTVYLMSDGGLPAFCDPGQKLVDLCHQHSITVTATPFPNSISLAVSLSGFAHERFIFEGFISRDKRNKELKRIAAQKEMCILMDTPYRLDKLVKELSELCPNREAFLGIDLNSSTQLLRRNSLKKLSEDQYGKREFILILK